MEPAPAEPSTLGGGANSLVDHDDDDARFAEDHAVAVDAAVATGDVGAKVWALTVAAADKYWDETRSDDTIRTVCRSFPTGDTTVSAINFMRAGGLNAVADLLDLHRYLASETMSGVLLLVAEYTAAQGVIAQYHDRCTRVAHSLARAAVACRWGADQDSAECARRAVWAACNLTFQCVATRKVGVLVDWIAATAARGIKSLNLLSAVWNLLAGTARTERATRRKNAWTLQRAGVLDDVLDVLDGSDDTLYARAAYTIRDAWKAAEVNDSGDSNDEGSEDSEEEDDSDEGSEDSKKEVVSDDRQDVEEGERRSSLWPTWVASGFAHDVMRVCAVRKDGKGPHVAPCAELYSLAKQHIASARTGTEAALVAELEARHAAELQHVRVECAEATRARLQVIEAKHAAELERVQLELAADVARRVQRKRACGRIVGKGGRRARVGQPSWSECGSSVQRRLACNWRRQMRSMRPSWSTCGSRSTPRSPARLARVSVRAPRGCATRCNGLWTVTVDTRFRRACNA